MEFNHLVCYVQKSIILILKFQHYFLTHVHELCIKILLLLFWTQPYTVTAVLSCHDWDTVNTATVTWLHHNTVAGIATLYLNEDKDIIVLIKFIFFINEVFWVWCLSWHTSSTLRYCLSLNGNTFQDKIIPYWCVCVFIFKVLPNKYGIAVFLLSVCIYLEQNIYYSLYSNVNISSLTYKP